MITFSTNDVDAFILVPPRPTSFFQFRLVVILDQARLDSPLGRMFGIGVIANVLNPKVVKMTRNVAGQGAKDVDEEIKSDAESDQDRLRPIQDVSVLLCRIGI